MELDLRRRAVAEAVGTALLVAAVVGSGIMAERLADGNVAVALLCNTLATGGALVALILALGPVSGAHFNPVVTGVALVHRELAARHALVYVVAQCVGGVAGTALANAMFDLPLIAWSQTHRDAAHLWIAEAVATFGLVGVILATSRRRAAITPLAVAAYIVGAYWFTSSTSFANPAVTLARTASDTFAGIRPVDAPAFVVAQLVGGGAGAALFAWLVPRRG